MEKNTKINSKLSDKICFIRFLSGKFGLDPKKISLLTGIKVKKIQNWLTVVDSTKEI
jgi:hypothetical protein